MTSSAQDQERPRGGSGEMFDRIATRYDLLNRIISLGIDQSWRARTLAAMEIRQGHRVLDLATGTADIALQIAVDEPSARVVGLDPSREMLTVGREKVVDAQAWDRVDLVEGDAQALPYDDDSFDSVCIAFGIRNVPDRGKALAEMARVTRPGGRIAILELSEPEEGPMAPLARFHVHTVVPLLGAILSGSWEYRYLQKSIAAFPPAAEFGTLMEASGLEVLEIVPLTFGVAHLYVARPAAPGLRSDGAEAVEKPSAEEPIEATA